MAGLNPRRVEGTLVFPRNRLTVESGFAVHNSAGPVRSHMKLRRRDFLRDGGCRIASLISTLRAAPNVFILGAGNQIQIVPPGSVTLP